MKYAKIIGEKERAVEVRQVRTSLAYTVLPSFSATPTHQASLVTSCQLLHWAMPSKYHSIHKNDLGARDGGRSRSRRSSRIAQGNTPMEADRGKSWSTREMEALLRQGRKSDES